MTVYTCCGEKIGAKGSQGVFVSKNILKGNDIYIFLRFYLIQYINISNND